MTFFHVHVHFAKEQGDEDWPEEMAIPLAYAKAEVTIKSEPETRSAGLREAVLCFQ
jgi:hypothetical protein